MNWPPPSLFFFFSVTPSQHSTILPHLLSYFLISSTTNIGRQLYLPPTATQSLKMCIHEFYRSKICGHHFPKLEQPVKVALFSDPCPTISVPQSLTCIPVKFALKFYHDQVVYLPAEVTYNSKVEIPRSCPIVHSFPNGTKREVKNTAYRGQMEADLILSNAMERHGLHDGQKWQIQYEAAILDRCSNRAKPGAHDPAELKKHQRLTYPANMYAHVQDVKAYQERDRCHMMPNVVYFEVDFGCGGPFSANCLAGWDLLQLLTHRLHHWGDGTIHPRPCSDDCLAGWSGVDLDAYRRQTWPGDMASGWRDTDYNIFAHKFLFKKTRHSQQCWTALDFSNVSHRHPDQFKMNVWDGSKFMRVTQPMTKYQSEKHVPECVWVPVPNRLHQLVTYRPEPEPKPKPKPKPVMTPEMEEKRVRRAWDRIRAQLYRDHSMKKEECTCQTKPGLISILYPSATRRLTVLIDSNRATL